MSPSWLRALLMLPPSLSPAHVGCKNLTRHVLNPVPGGNMLQACCRGVPTSGCGPVFGIMPRKWAPAYRSHQTLPGGGGAPALSGLGVLFCSNCTFWCPAHSGESHCVLAVPWAPVHPPAALNLHFVVDSKVTGLLKECGAWGECTPPAA